MKSKKKRREVDEALSPLREQLERWRRDHGSGSARIPEEFWREAAKAAEIHGVSAVATCLKLDYYRLKDRVRIKKPPTAKKVPGSKPSFIEVFTPASTSPSLPNTIEIQRAGGSRVRLEFENTPSKELLKLSERLWRTAR